jgi:hypothetical protein
LCQVKVNNIAQPVDLFELVRNPESSWLELQQSYEQALADFERKEFASATRELGNLLSNFQNDGPTVQLLGRAVRALGNGPETSHPVWVLESK